MLSGYAEHTTDRVWTVSAASLLRAINAGRDPSDFASFLAQHTDHELPDALGTLISDVTRRSALLTDLGHAQVIECPTGHWPRSLPTTVSCVPCAIRLVSAISPCRLTRN